MRRGLLVLLLAGITAAVWSAVGSQAGTKHSSSGSSVTIANVAGMSWTCGFNPFNSTVQFLSFGPIYEELVFVNALKSGCPDAVARVEVQVVEPREDADLHDQEGRQVVGREAAHRRRRPLHVPAPQEAPGARPPGRVVRAEEREPQGETRSSSSSSPRRRRTSTTSPARRRSCRSTSGPRSPNPVKYPDKAPVGSGPYTVRPSTCNAQRIIYTKNTHYWQKGKPKIDHGRLPGLHRQLARERGARHRPGPVGRPVHPEHQDLLHLEEQGQPLLVPAGGERLDLHQPQEPDPQERRCSARDGVRDQPPARRQDRRVRLRASGQPDRDRVAHVQELAEQEAREEGRLRPGEGEVDPQARRLQAEERRTSTRSPASRCRSR